MVHQHVPITTKPFSIPNLHAPSSGAPMPLPINQIESAINRTIGSSPTRGYSDLPEHRQRFERESRVNEAALYEPPIELVRANKDFMSEFEEFFRGEPVKVGGTIASSGFQHQEEEEYF